MVHGDDMGLRLPPLMAPVQVVVVPIYRKGADAAAITAAAQKLVEQACQAGIRAKLDSDGSKSPGFRFSYWEQKVNPASWLGRALQVLVKYIVKEKYSAAIDLHIL